MADPEIVVGPSEVPVETPESSFNGMIIDGNTVEISPKEGGALIEEEEWMEVQIGPQHFDLLKLIGEGAFGKVLLVRNRFEKESMFAMKVISKKLIKKKNNVLYMKSERDILTKIHHPFIVHLHYAFQSESKLFLVMDFLSGGELFYHLRRRGIILEKEVLFYLAEMIVAIEFLHNKGIIHRDLKPENVLLRGDGHVCITDFGLAKEIGDGNFARTLCGTSEYMAPEMLTRNGYGKGVDWWSLEPGALCFEMLTGKPPFTAKTQKDLDKKILNEKFIAPSYLSGNTHALLKGMLEKDVNKRLGSTKSTMFSIGGVAALKQHAFFAGLDWQALEALELTPPIDLSVRYPSTSTTTSTKEGSSAKNTPQKSATPGEEGGAAAAADDVWTSTAHFDEEFTNRDISYSFIEDTMFSTTHTPVRSRANSGDGTTDGSNVDEYAGFDFAVEKFECTLQQMREFEAELQVKTAKQNKKKLLRQKNEERRQAEEVLKKAAAEQEAVEKKRVEEEKRLQKARAEEQRQLELQRKERRRVLQLQADQNKTHNAGVREYQEKCSKVGKKLKANRKKLRDIQTLEESVAASGGSVKLSSEQKDKLKRKGDLEAEIARDEAEEKALLAASPGELLCEDVEELLRIEEERGRAKGGETSRTESVGVADAAVAVAPGMAAAKALIVEPPTPSDSPVPSEELSTSVKDAKPEKKSVWVSPRVQALMKQQQEAEDLKTQQTHQSQPSASISEKVSLVVTSAAVAAPPQPSNGVSHEHKHTTSGAAPSGGCGCGDHLNSSSITKKEFMRQKDEWETVTSGSSKGKKKK